MTTMATRRGNREGSFRLRKDGRWEGRVMVAGLGRFSVFGKTRDEARRKLATCVEGLEAGLRPPSARLTVGEWLDEWLVASQGRLAPRTLASYEDTVRLHLRPALGTIPLARLSAGHISRLLAAKGRDPNLHATTVRYIYSILRIAMGRAVKDGRVSRNVCLLIDPPRRADTEIAILTPVQTHSLVDTLALSPHECLIVTGLATGLRQSELCGLWWSDIDFDAATLTVRAQLDRGGVTRANQEGQPTQGGTARARDVVTPLAQDPGDGAGARRATAIP